MHSEANGRGGTRTRDISRVRRALWPTELPARQKTEPYAARRDLRPGRHP